MITYYKCKNMAGIFAGTGKLELELDFTKKATNKIIALLGKNGSGKTTLLSLLNPLRGTNDERKDFILEGKEGYEEIHLLIENHKYIIKHFYGNNFSKNKSFITKDGEEMNENGGIKTYMNYLKEEFNLDNSYFTIARIGSNVDGFIKKSTAERKKYMNEFVPNIDDYLEKFEIVNEKYRSKNNELKSLKDSIKNYDHEELLLSKDQYSSNINQLNKTIESDKYQLAVYETELKKYNNEIKGIDPNIENIYKENYEKFIEYENKYDLYIEKFPKLSSYDSESIPIKLYESEMKKDNAIKNIEIIKEKIDNLNKELNSLSEKRNQSELTVEEIKSGIIDITEIKIQTANTKIEIEENKEKIDELVDYLNDLTYFDNYSKYDFEIAINQYKTFVDNMNSLYSYDMLMDLKNIKSNIEIIIKENEKLNNIELVNLNSEINKVSSEITLTENLKEKYMKTYNLYLNTDCGNKNCPFVKEAIQVMEVDSSKLNRKYEYLDTLNKEKKEIENKIEENNNKLICIENLNKFKLSDIQILEEIMNYLKLNKEDLLTRENIDYIIDILETNLEVVNLLLEVEQLNSILDKNLKTIDNNELKINLLNNEENNLKEINEKINKYENEKEILNEELKTNERTSKISNNTIIIMNNLKDILKNKENYEKVYLESKNIYENNKDILEKIKSINSNIYYINENTKDNITLLDENKKSLEEIKNKLYLFDVYSNKIKDIEGIITDIGLVKEALDPKKGIPLIFMEDYITIVEEKTNELLDKAYNGDFQISFEIGKKDFLIKVLKSDGTFLNDITLASQGELSLTTIALSLAMIETLLENCKYKVVYFDEVDSSLDSKNRKIYIDILQTMLDSSIDQCFMITHNDEFYSQPIDMILLKDNNINTDDKDFMKNKNIIFNINEE